MSVQDRCMVCARCTIGLQIVLDRLLGSCGISLLSVCRQCWYRCKIGAWFALNVPWAYKSFWTYPMEPLGDVGHVESCFFLF